jgi:peptide deformylase
MPGVTLPYLEQSMNTQLIAPAVTAEEGITRQVLTVPDPALNVAARACDGIDDRVLAIAADLLATMRANPRCVGLAAPQVGELVRIIAMDVSEHPKATSSHGPLVLINPVVVCAAGEEVGREGCLSIPGLTANVRRALHVMAVGLAPSGEEVTVEPHGFEARVLQHELDHLDGILILDRVASTADIFARKSSRLSAPVSLAR